MSNRIPQPPRIYFYRWKVYINWRIKRSEWIMRTGGKETPWQIVTEDFIFFGLHPLLFGRDSVYYDGHTIESFSFLHFIIGKGHQYESKELLP